MGQANGFRQVFISAKGSGYPSSKLGNLQRVSKPCPVVVTFIENKNLCLVFKTSKSGRMNDPVTIALKYSADRRLRFQIGSSSGSGWLCDSERPRYLPRSCICRGGIGSLPCHGQDTCGLGWVEPRIHGCSADSRGRRRPCRGVTPADLCAGLFGTGRLEHDRPTGEGEPCSGYRKRGSVSASGCKEDDRRDRLCRRHDCQGSHRESLDIQTHQSIP